MTRRWSVTLPLVALLAAGALGAASRGSAAGPPKLTLERLHADPPLTGSLPTRLAWHPDGKRLTFLRPSAAGFDLHALDVSRGEQTLLVAGKSVLGPDKRPVSLALARWLPDGRTLLVPAGGDLFLVDPATAAVQPLVQTKETEEFAEASPDGRRVAFVRGGDLYVVDVASRRETRLTRSGSETVLNGRLDWVYEEELAARSGQAFTWSPDSRAIAYLQLDQSRVARFPIVDFLSPANDVAWQRYPRPGTPNAVVRLGVVALDKEGAGGPERLLSFDPDDVYVLPQLAWTRDSRHVAFQHLNRAQNELELRLLPVPEGAAEPFGPVQTILRERSDTWVNTFEAPLFLRDGRRFLWVSERDGFAHVYVCDLGGRCRPVTQGRWAVDAQVSFASAPPPLQLDERSGFLYYTATEKDPRERHLYRTRLDGTGRVRLTTEDGTHRTLVSRDGRFYADVFSSVGSPPAVWVSSQDGTRRFPVDETPPPLAEYEQPSVEWMQLSSGDGTPLYASLLKPADFDPARKYPVVVDVYGGPHVQMVTNSWLQASPFDRLLASRGFLVFRLDNRGSAGRGHAFEAAIQRQLGRVELEDQLVGVEHLKSLPYVDGSRIGIVGWSYGGFMALYAATHAPGVFRAAVAGAPVADWRQYDSIYAERYLGRPEQNRQGYDASSPLSKAAATDSDLLLLHGTADDNVHLSNTLAFVAELIQADRPYSLALHPRQMHGFSTRADKLARDRAVLAHLERALLGR